jgi:phosphate transport system substrate-binding protein
MNKKLGFLKIRAHSPVVLLIILLSGLILGACGDNTPMPAATSAQVVSGGNSTVEVSKLKANLNGSGSSFAGPAFSAWQLAFGRQSPEVLVNYQPLGSGQGRSDFLAGKTDFGASDVQITTEEAQGSKRNLNDIVQVPLMLGAIVLAFSLDGVKELNFTPETVCGIYTGKITRWSDPKLKTDNPSANLPDIQIELVVRADKSGTTEVFTQYLSAICPEFKDKVGVSGLPDWKKLGLEVDAEPQNAGVAGLTSSVLGALGYIEQDYAVQRNLPYVALKNQSGKFIKPGADNISAAAIELKDSAGLKLDLINRSGENVYPIVATTYLLLNREYPDKTKAQAVVSFAQYILGQGQRDVQKYTYIPLPASVLNMAQNKLNLITAGGAPVPK